MVLSLLLATQIAVIAHRGEHLKHAENSIAAIQSAIQLGADYVELDVRTTLDGKLVLMHDKTVDRTTDGRGQVKDLTLERKVVAFDQDDFKPALIQQAMAMKADIYVDRLDEQDNAQAWQDAIDRGAKGIQTNHPAELLEFLRDKHLHP